MRRVGLGYISVLVALGEHAQGPGFDPQYTCARTRMHTHTHTHTHTQWKETRIGYCTKGPRGTDK
jgi:hypothetical protein